MNTPIHGRFKDPLKVHNRTGFDLEGGAVRNSNRTNHLIPTGDVGPYWALLLAEADRAADFAIVKKKCNSTHRTSPLRTTTRRPLLNERFCNGNVALLLSYLAPV
jgi:hypothetical protein